MDCVDGKYRLLKVGVVPVTGTAVPDMGQQHVNPGERHAPYNSVPPTSGPHYGSGAPVAWGSYTNAIPEEVWIHNLEHGGIVALYNCPQACPDLVSKLDALVKSGPASKYGSPKIVVTPYSKITNKLTLVAWDYYLPLDDYDDGAVRGFFAAHQDRGPEDVP